MKAANFHNVIQISICLLIVFSGHNAIGQARQSEQIDSLEIKGPHEVRPGELIRLVANTGPKETPFWIVLDPIALDYEQVDQGKRLIFSATCKTDQTITVMLLAQQVRDGRIITRQLRRTVHVGNPAFPPAPPDPTLDDLEKSPLYGAVLEAWPLIITDAGKALSPKVVENLKQIADMCLEGKFPEAHMVWEKLSKQNRKDLQLESLAWDPVGRAIQKQFKQLALDNIKAHAFHLRSAAAAINDAYVANQKNQNRKAIRP